MKEAFICFIGMLCIQPLLPGETFLKALPLLPVAVLLAAINAFTEEAYYRDKRKRQNLRRSAQISVRCPHASVTPCPRNWLMYR